jgi:uncharacterized protein (DUF4415 family)
MKRTTARQSAPRTARIRQAIQGGVARAGAAGWTPEKFARELARQGLKPVPRKTLLSLRIDSDVIEWFRSQGAGYQSRMNALLRAYMEAHQ